MDKSLEICDKVSSRIYGPLSRVIYHQITMSDRDKVNAQIYASIWNPVVAQVCGRIWVQIVKDVHNE